jgi:ubiquinone/menaquinone biosynthesis C-methylase UbiE
VSGNTASPAGSGGAGRADRYLLGDSTAEVEHLVNQAEVYADVAAELLDRVGLAAGASAIDVGCGALGILRLLCERVGPSGRVVGLDREARLLDAARKAADRHGLPIEFVQGDATSLDLPTGSFDFVHERTVLLNVQDPATVVSELIRIARPGDYYQTFLLTLTGLVRDQIITGGRLTAAEFDAQAASLRAHLEQPGTLTGMAEMWQAWGTKP